MHNTTKKLAYPYALWITIIIVLPVFLIFLYSITLTSDDSPISFQFTFDHYLAFFAPSNFNVLIKSFNLAVLTTIFTLLIGYPIAWIISQLNKKIQNAVLLLFILPMWINMLLRTYAWQIILSRDGILDGIIQFFNENILNLIGLNIFYDGLLYTDTAVLIGMIYNFLPFMVFPIYTALLKINRSLFESSKDLGANTTQTFIKVILPLSLPGIITGIIMVFLPVISTFAIPRLLGGGDYILIGNLIEKQFLLLNNWSFGSAVSMILMIMILLSMRFMKTNDDKTKGGGTLPW